MDIVGHCSIRRFHGAWLMGVCLKIDYPIPWLIAIFPRRTMLFGRYTTAMEKQKPPSDTWGEPT